MHVNMVFAHYTFEYPHVLGVTDLHEQVSTPELDVACQHMVTVLRDPNDVCCQPSDRMAAVPILFHRHDFYHALELCSN